MRLQLKKLLCLLQALLMLLSQIFTLNGAYKIKTDRAAIGLTSERDVSFAAISADALQVSAQEKQRCRAWYDAHIRTADDPAYDFTVGGQSLRRHLRDWMFEIGEESAVGAVERGGKSTVISLRHKKSDLTARVEATIFEENAACQWTVYLRNEGDSRSPVIRRFYAADCTLDTGETTLYVSRGSNSQADDFELLHTAVTPTTMIFDATEGRNTSYLPYFNLSGSKGGAVAAVGWTGQWRASLRQTLQGVKLRAQQAFFRAALEPQEEVRSPLVSLTFYDGDNALKGFNSFRQMQLDCLYPETMRPMRGYMLANEFCTLTCDELIETVQTTDPAILGATDYFWMDAGWYTYKKDWYDGVGNWTPDATRFPASLRPLSDAIAQSGSQFLLWYEPERVRAGTILEQEGVKHDGWIIRNGDNLLWNLADDGACAFLTDYIAASLEENGVGVYRQDFNFDPLRYWKQADHAFYGGRTGICENHYVTNLYRFLDTLCDRVDGLLIDNCASGGRRIDLEMCRRSVPLWRSDYNCVPADGSRKADDLEATQAMTYALSCWLPYSGTVQHTESLYAERSGVMTHPMVMNPDPATYALYDDVRADMTKRYFPLAGGGTDDSKALAMQFGDAESGSAMLYLRKSTAPSYQLRLNGLSPDKAYVLTDPDDPTFLVRETGQTLMETGVTLTAAALPHAFILSYTADA